MRQHHNKAFEQPKASAAYSPMRLIHVLIPRLDLCGCCLFDSWLYSLVNMVTTTMILTWMYVFFNYSSVHSELFTLDRWLQCPQAIIWIYLFSLHIDIWASLKGVKLNCKTLWFVREMMHHYCHFALYTESRWWTVEDATSPSAVSAVWSCATLVLQSLTCLTPLLHHQSTSPPHIAALIRQIITEDNGSDLECGGFTASPSRPPQQDPLLSFIVRPRATVHCEPLNGKWNAVTKATYSHSMSRKDDLLTGGGG